MSERHLEIVREVYERWANGDWSALPPLDEHVVFTVTEDFPEWGVFHGPDGVETFTRRWLDQQVAVSVAAKELTLAGDTVLARVRHEAQGRVSQLPLGIEWFQVWTFRGERVIRLDCVMDEADARAAAGLVPQ